LIGQWHCTMIGVTVGSERAQTEESGEAAAAPMPMAGRAAGTPLTQQIALLQRSAGNRATARLIGSNRRLSRSAWDEFSFGVRHPVVSGQIYGGEQAAEVAIPSTSSLAVRFSVNLRTDRQTDIGSGGLTENAQHEGSEVNAMRHTLWNAINTRRFGLDLATEAANAHEANPHAIDAQDPATQTFPTLLAADESCDLRNNILGRELGVASTASAKELASYTLQLFRDRGLWVAQQQGDGTYKAVRQTLTSAAFDAAAAKLNNLNEIGLTPAGAARWRAARDQELRDAQSGLYD
jgi:hypothetical protein